MKRSEAKLRDTSVRMTIKEPRTVGYILCQEKVLEDALVSIMEELANTGGDNSSLSCRVYERCDRVVVEHMIDGIGIALERLKALEAGKHDRPANERGLITAKESIQEMGGAVTLRSVLGKGIELRVEMERFV
jgi:K+-sensing histidine kinase KdpD